MHEAAKEAAAPGCWMWAKHFTAAITSSSRLEETPATLRPARWAAAYWMRNSPEPAYRSSTNSVGLPVPAQTALAVVQMPTR